MTVELVLGGARSGKSRYALQHALNAANVTWIATAQAFDAEMQQRISHHQAERPSHWRTLETPLYLSQTLAQQSDQPMIVVDCLTLWVSNWLCQPTQHHISDHSIQDTASHSLTAEWQTEQTDFLRQIERFSHLPQQLILVSNEVGFGIVPDNPLARLFRDEVGRLHQQIATIANAVTLVVAGLPLSIKPHAQD
ncbi:MAG: bifunctional adenosylcobinamide kinase/adenosylcobinamide-phosphate guanylyltransferase [Moraxellaceae bacterium]